MELELGEGVGVAYEVGTAVVDGMTVVMVSPMTTKLPSLSPAKTSTKESSFPPISYTVVVGPGAASAGDGSRCSTGEASRPGWRCW